VIEPEEPVAALLELLDRGEEDGDLPLRGGQVLVLEAALSLRDPRHVCVAVKRDPVRSDLDHRVNSSIERLDRLERQAVDEIEVDAAESELPSLPRDPLRLLP
jgi:hypothetical protein